MFDVGFWELSLIGVLALVILGPERLPVAARTLGRWVRRGRRFVSNFGEELSGDSSIGDLREEVRRMRSEIEEQTRETMNDVEGGANEGNTANASGHNRNQPHSMYEFSLDDVDNAPGAGYEHDNEAAVADESVEADDIADDFQDSSSSAPESSVDASAMAGESVELADAHAVADDDDEEALYARARRRYAGVNQTNDIEHDTTDDAVSAQAKSSTLNE